MKRILFLGFLLLLSSFVSTPPTYEEAYEKLGFEKDSKKTLETLYESINAEHKLYAYTSHIILSQIDYTKFKENVVSFLKNNYTRVELVGLINNYKEKNEIVVKPQIKDAFYQLGKLNGRELGGQLLNKIANVYKLKPGVTYAEINRTRTTDRNEKPNYIFEFKGTKIRVHSVEKYRKAYAKWAEDYENYREEGPKPTFEVSGYLRSISYYLWDTCEKFNDDHYNEFRKTSKFKYLIIKGEPDCHPVSSTSILKYKDVSPRCRPLGILNSSTQVRVEGWNVIVRNSESFKTLYKNSVSGSCHECYGKPDISDATCGEKRGYLRDQSFRCKCKYTKLNESISANLIASKDKLIKLCADYTIDKDVFKLAEYLSKLAYVIKYETFGIPNTQKTKERNEISEMLEKVIHDAFTGKLDNYDLRVLKNKSCNVWYLSKSQVLSVYN